MSSNSSTSREFLIVADFNAGNLVSLITSGSLELPIRARSAPFGPVLHHLLSRDPELWSRHTDGAVVWATPQGVSEAYKRRMQGDSGSLDEIVEETRRYAEALKRLPDHIRNIFVPTFSVFHPMHARRGLLDMDPEQGLAIALMRMNVALGEHTQGDSRIRIFDSSRWSALTGEKSYDPRLWYAAKTPFSISVFKNAIADFIAALRGLEGRARKLLVLDLDNTLWGGILGDEGWEGLRVGGHDAVGEAYRDFQAALKALSRRGVLLSIASKNDEAAALEALSSHPEMLLRPGDFAGWKINWDDKARNIAALVKSLNLGLDSAVFIDDNPVERDRVRAALPDVLVPDWPSSPLFYCSALAALDCFDAPVVSEEDRARTAMYVAERERQLARENIEDLGAWMRSLEITIKVDQLGEASLARANQLLNKTNQMNLATRRMSAQEFWQWAIEPGHRVYVFRVTDRFGDYGLVGIASLEVDRDSATASVSDFVLSCRVLGRQVEESMLFVLGEAARAQGCTELVADYIPTAKNGPCLSFLEKNLRHLDGSNRFVVSLEAGRSAPDCTTIVWDEKPFPSEDRTAGLARAVD